MNKSFTVKVACKDEGTKTRFEALATRMNEDTEFKTKPGCCKNEQEVYDLYSDQ